MSDPAPSNVKCLMNHHFDDLIKMVVIVAAERYMSIRQQVAHAELRSQAVIRYFLITALDGMRHQSSHDKLDGVIFIGHSPYRVAQQGRMAQQDACS